MADDALPQSPRETGGSWWGGWLESAKAKSASAVEFLKKDLQEFTNVMKEDTTKAAVDVKKQLTQENATAATQKVKEGMSKVLVGITKALVIESEEKEQTRAGRKPSGEHIFDRAKARLRAIQLDPSTYCDEPEGSPQDYNKWLDNFVLDSKKGDISELLVANVDVRSLYTQLVPSEVSHADFWHRYFYKLYKLDQDEARKAALMKRADVVQEQLDLEWEDDDWGDIEGPSSPPKPTAGNMHDAMAPKSMEKQNCTVSEGDPILQKDEQKFENDPRVPVNGTPLVESTATQDESSNQIPDTLKEGDGEPKPTDSDSTSVSQGLNENIHSETNTQESVALGKEEVAAKEEVLQPDAADSNTSPAAQPVSLAQEMKNPVSDNTSVSTAPSVMEPLSVDTNIKMRDKGDMVVVGSEGTTPSSESTACTNKESTGLDDDWEKDFDDDVEVTEEDMRLAAEAAKKLAETGAIVDDGDDDWESWD